MNIGNANTALFCLCILYLLIFSLWATHREGGGREEHTSFGHFYIEVPQSNNIYNNFSVLLSLGMVIQLQACLLQIDYSKRIAA